MESSAAQRKGYPVRIHQPLMESKFYFVFNLSQGHAPILEVLQHTSMCEVLSAHSDPISSSKNSFDYCPLVQDVLIQELKRNYFGS